jgi:hypothetical protein
MFAKRRNITKQKRPNQGLQKCGQLASGKMYRQL